MSAQVPDAAGANGWLMFRGNRRRTGSADVAGPRQANLKWVFRTQGRIYADAAVSRDGQTIYVASHDHHLYAVDLDGRKKWSFDAGGKIWTSPAISTDGHVYIGSDEDALFALDSEGKVQWKFITTEATPKGVPKPEAGRFDVDTSPLLMDDGTVVFGCHLKLIALRPAAGDLRWAFTAGTGRSKIFSSPAQSPDGTLFFGTQGNYFFALNQASDVLWTATTDGDNDSTPVVDLSGNVFFASDDGKVRSIAPGNKVRWIKDAGAAIRAPLGLSSDGTLYAATYGNAPFVLALDKDTGREKWRFSIKPGLGDFYGIQSGITTDRQGYVYFGGRDGFVYCLNPKGQLVWKHQTDDQVDSGPVLGADGTLYVGSDDGRLYAFAR
ncbi:MAG: PQQ-like beta-propeller repeat protein [Deltaproteobacteria bacterium]|nr:PQQ-like beta-propeller repeat protein [Deltaproteobacteria bacterium]